MTEGEGKEPKSCTIKFKNVILAMGFGTKAQILTLNCKKITPMK